MNLLLATTLLVVTLYFNSVIATQPTDSKDLKLAENQYASPQLYFFGGREESGEDQTSASHYNSSTDELEATTEMSLSKRSSCGALAGTKIYLFGGFSQIVGKALKTAEVYDCETGTYSQFRSMLNRRYGCGAAVLNDYIYVAGGHDDITSLSSVVRYNIHTTRRENVSSLHTARFGLQLVELGGHLYAIGGTTNTVEMYNPTTGHWFAVASTQYAHTYFGATAHEGKIYVCSAQGFEVYSPETDQWETLTSPNNHEGRTLVSMNGKLWALGGGNDEQKGTKSVFVYNTSTKKWTERAGMDVARRWFTSFVVIH